MNDKKQNCQFCECALAQSATANEKEVPMPDPNIPSPFTQQPGAEVPRLDACLECGSTRIVHSKTCSFYTTNDERIERELTELLPLAKEAFDARAFADRAYCDYIEQMNRPECQGVDAKLRTGEFGKTELKAHVRAGELIGRHRAFTEVAAAAQAASGAQPEQTFNSYWAAEAMDTRIWEIFRTGNLYAVAQWGWNSRKLAAPATAQLSEEQIEEVRQGLLWHDIHESSPEWATQMAIGLNALLRSWAQP